MVSGVNALRRALLALAWLGTCAAATNVQAQAQAQAQPPERFIVMASTTSTEQSGLFPHLLPAFTAATGVKVRVVAVGTGQALDMGRRGDADVLFVHDRAAEDQFVAEGFGLPRRDVMFNDFVLIGPAADPAGARGNDIAAALAKLAAANAAFVSRGDKSGTHAAELRYWKIAGIDPGASLAPPAKPGTLDYKACGCGMGPALNMASATNAYVLADRGTWLAFRNRGELRVLVEGDKRLFNPYGVIVVNPARHPHTKTALAQAFADWVVSPSGQARIASYRVDGEPVFFPSAKP